MALCPGLPGWACTNSPTHRPDHHPIFISFLHLLRSTASSMFNLRAWQSFCTTLSTSSLVYLLVWSPEPNIPYIFSPNQCRLFATHAHTIVTCFVVVPTLYHLFLVFLSTPYSTVSFTLTLHIHWTILISAGWSATSFSFLTGQVSLRCSILLRIQLLYNLLISDIFLLVSNGTNCLNLFHPVQMYTINIGAKMFTVIY